MENEFYEKNKDFGSQNSGSNYNGSRSFNSSYSNNNSNSSYNGSSGGQNNGYRNNNFRGKKKVDTSEGKLYKPFLTVANRDVPTDVIERIVKIVKILESKEFTLRSGGGNDGLDPHTEGVSSSLELYLPWKGFNGKDTKNYFNTTQAMDIAKQFSPVWENMKPAVQSFMGKNVRMVIGDKLKSPVMFVICWSADGAETSLERSVKTGNIGHLIAIANAMRIPVFNFGKHDAGQRLHNYLELKNE